MCWDWDKVNEEMSVQFLKSADKKQFIKQFFEQYFKSSDFFKKYIIVFIINWEKELTYKESVISIKQEKTSVKKSHTKIKKKVKKKSVKKKNSDIANKILNALVTDTLSWKHSHSELSNSVEVHMRHSHHINDKQWREMWNTTS